MRIDYRERHRRVREAEIAAWNDSYNAEQDPGLREAYRLLPRAPIRLICNRLVKDVNHGGMLRLAEALRLERVFFSPEDDAATDFAGHRGTVDWQPYEFIHVLDAVDQARRDGYRTAAVSLNERARPLSEMNWSFPLALVMGEERFGIPPDVEEMCDEVVAIPLFGIVQSLNVTTAAAIVLHAATGAYAAAHTEFEPARNASRRLLGLPETRYE